ncbi:MAG: PQQ-dependent sugar dehydrogenase [Myxococcota bacterium]
MLRRILLAAPVLFAASAEAQTLVPTNDLDFSVFQDGLNAPSAAEFLPDGRLVITQQGGRFRVRPAAGGALINAGQVSVITNINEQGLLGIAIDPQFSTSNRIYFYYSENGSSTSDRHHVAWATIDPVTSIIDTANLHIIVRDLFGPANHNGGGIKFGPDGYLYIGVGDTGCNCACAPGTANNYFGTNLAVANGKILRVDRDGNIPASNPLTGAGLMVPGGGSVPRPCSNGPNVEPNMNNPVAPRTDIYNWGFRNPWRFSFDEQTGYLWIGDVGEVTYEEVTVSTGPGQHHGWPWREGFHGDPGTACPMSTGLAGVPATQENCTEPVYEYSHNGGAASITGGVFSNHCSWPAPWAGRYWFADYDMQYHTVWTLTPDPASGRRQIVANSREDVLTNAGGVVHFFNGPDGAVYMVNINAGEIWRVAPKNPVVCAPPDAGIWPDAEPLDTGVFEPDGGPADTAVAIPDAGLSPTDTGVTPQTDSGIAAADANSLDAGSIGMAKSGCGCSTASPGAAISMLLLGAAVVLMRRRR